MNSAWASRVRKPGRGCPSSAAAYDPSMESDSADTTVNVHINRLRRRFEDYPEFELLAVRGLGYKAVKKV